MAEKVSARADAAGIGEGRAEVMKTSPWYSTLTRTVYHDNTSCTEGNNIERHYRREGTGGLPRCSHCSRLG